MKKLLYTSIISVLCLGFVGCGSSNDDGKLTSDDESFLNDEIDKISQVIPGVELVSMEKEVQKYETGDFLQLILTLESGDSNATHVITYTKDLEIRDLTTSISSDENTTNALVEYTNIIQVLFGIDDLEIVDIRINLITDELNRDMNNRELSHYYYGVSVLSETVYRFVDQEVVNNEKPHE